jgi:hypothetical protein
MSNRYNKLLSIIAVAFASLTLSVTCHGLGLTSGTSTSFFKTLPDGDLVCESDAGEMAIEASFTKDTDTGDITDIDFVMESPLDSIGDRITTTCCEVAHDSGHTVANCDAGFVIIDDQVETLDCDCAEFTLDQKVEDPITVLDDVASNCLQLNTEGGLETYRCTVSNGAPKEFWLWHLIPANPDPSAWPCDTTQDCTACGVAWGTTDNAKPGDHDPFGIVWQYQQYKDSDGNTLLADFQGNWCHTGSFCLDDPIVCETSGKNKIPLKTDGTGEFVIIPTDTVQTLNGDSFNGSVPNDFYSVTDDNGDILVDATEIKLDYIHIDESLADVLSYSISDQDGDGVDDLRVHIDQESYRDALFGVGGDCVEGTDRPVTFSGTFIEGSALEGKEWLGPTTVNVNCK